MVDTEKLKDLQLNAALACRREAIGKKDKTYLRRCERLIKRLAKQKGVADVCRL